MRWMAWQGRSRAASTSLWHWAQATLVWMVPARWAGVTCSERPSLVALTSGFSWQDRQSRSAMPWA